MLRKTLLAYSIGLLTSTTVYAQGLELAAIDFDTNTLKSLGLDPKVSHYFSHTARFLPGEHLLALSVNGDKMGNIVVRFDNEGNPCLDRNLLQQARLKIPNDNNENGCFDYAKSYPGTEISPLTAKEQLNILVPPQARVPATQDQTDAVSGGRGALLNYSLLTSRSEFSNDSSDYSQASLEGGININDWMLRSHQFFTQSNGRFSNQNSSTYVEHTFVGQKMLMRAGQVNINNSLLEGAGLYGIELAPDRALQSEGSGVQVTGIANTHQARVEIRQQGILLLSTLVPAGAFTIPDIPVRSMNSDIQVTVIETTGSEHSYTVPTTLFARHVGTGVGYRVALGRVDGHYDESPWVLSLSDSWNPVSWGGLSAGVIAAQQYQALATRADLSPVSDFILGSQINAARDNDDNLQGQKYQLDASYNLPYDLSVTTSISHQDRDYRTLADTLSDGDVDLTKSTYSLGINWSNALLGGFNISEYKTKSYDGKSDATNLSINWNKSFKYATFSVNWQHQLDSSAENEDDGVLFYVNISIPFGKANSATFYTRNDDHRSYYGTGVMGVVSDETSYYISAERNQDDKQNNFNGSVNTNLHYTQLNLSAGANGSDSRSYNGMLTGGIAFHNQGVTFSPWAIDDTFAIATVDNDVSGVKITTPSGPVWTDYNGVAVIPSLQPWSKSLVEIDTTTLPKNVDVGNGSKELKQSRGAIGNVGFNALIQRRALLNISTANGEKLPRGVTIEDKDGNYLTTSVDNGVVFINNVTPEMVLLVRDERQSCRIHLTFPAEAPNNVFYETATGICQ